MSSIDSSMKGLHQSKQAMSLQAEILFGWGGSARL
jgi:hypothetical protein